MSRKVLKVLVILACCNAVSCQYIAVVGPRTVQLQKDYTVFLSYVTSDGEPVDLKVDLKTVDGEDIETYNLKLVDTESYPLIFKLKSRPKANDFNLTVTCKSLKFDQSVIIHTIAKKYSVLIQTDKAIYKPGDSVQFRVLVLDAETKPYKYKKLEINVIDVAKSVVSTEKKKKGKDLVFESEVTIPDETFHGNWTIAVQVDDDKEKITEQTFEVNEYFLPLFETFGDTKPFVAITNRNIEVSIYAKYTFGEFVKGKATVVAKVYNSTHPDSEIKSKTFAVSDITITKQLTISLADDLSLSNILNNMIVKIEIVFEEELTRKQATKVETVTVFKTGSYRIDVSRPKLKFKPGFPYDLTVTVRNQDGSIITSPSTISFVIQTHLTLPKCTTKEERDNAIKQTEMILHKPLKSGIIYLHFNPPSNATAIVLTIKYFEITKVVNIVGMITNTREYLLANLATENPKVNEDIEIQVESTSDFDNIQYVVVGRTGIVANGSITLDSSEMSYKLTFKATAWMIPEAEVYIYYIHYTGEIVYDRIVLTFESDLPNKLAINVHHPTNPHKTTLKPRDDSMFTLTSTPNSTVYLLAVDDLHFSRTGNDIDKARMSAEYNQFTAFKNFSSIYTKENNLYVDNLNVFILTSADKFCFSLRYGYETFFNELELPSIVPTTDDIELTDYDSKTRKDLPETWIFEKFEIKEDGKFVFNRKVPDSIAAWDITGFSISNEYGLGLAKPQKLTVKQDFFIQLYLPYSIRIGETLKIEASVFSYFPNQKPDQFIDVTVTLYSETDVIEDVTVGESSLETESEEAFASEEVFNSDSEKQTEFEFYDSSKSSGICSYHKNVNDNINKQSTKIIKVGKNSGTPVHFFVRATKSGPITVKIRAEFKMKKKTIYDEVERTLKVEHEGLTEYYNHPILIDLDGDKVFNLEITTEIATDFKNSTRNQLSVVGNLMGPALVNTEKLIRMPSGCTEQRLVSFVPNTAAMQYLKATNQLTKERETAGENALRQGVTQTLSSRIKSGDKKGAFSIWGMRTTDHSDSIWLTAYIAKCFGKAKLFIAIDAKVIHEALQYLSKNQMVNGNFPENGRISYYTLQTDSSNGIPLTAFTAIAFLENNDYRKEFNETIQKALRYIDSNLHHLADNYALAIATYALALGEHESAEMCLKELEKTAFSTGEIMYWEKDMKGKTTTAQGTKVEIAAYAVLAYLKLNKATEALPIVKWLVKQRNSKGGFSSTQDTVIAIQALAEIATKLHSNNLNMDIKVTDDKGEEIRLKLKDDNDVTLLGAKLKPTLKSVKIFATGTGMVSLQVSQSYKNKMNESDGSFTLSALVQPTTNERLLNLKICTKIAVDFKESGMTLMEVTLPSGYVVDPEYELLTSAGVKKYELKHANSVVNLYFDSLGLTEICPVVKAIRVNVVDDLKSSPVKVYDYYNKNRFSTTYYRPQQLQLC